MDQSQLGRLGMINDGQGVRKEVDQKRLEIQTPRTTRNGHTSLLMLMSGRKFPQNINSIPSINLISSSRNQELEHKKTVPTFLFPLSVPVSTQFLSYYKFAKFSFYLYFTNKMSFLRTFSKIPGVRGFFTGPVLRNIKMYSPNNLEKKFLVWTGKYKTVEDIPPHIS